jgi:thiamine-monophosphate kinase
MAGGEDRLIAWLAGFAGAGDRIGDDAVLLTLGERQYAFSVDTQRAGVHIPVDLDPADAARRLLAVSLSDLAATGAEPRWMLVALGVDDEAGARRFLAALVRTGRRYEVELIGGDTARPTTPGRLDASLTVIGEVPEEGSPLTRDAARPDDRLWIGGAVGESALGLDLVRRGARIAKRRANLPEGIPDGLARVASRVLRRHLEPRPQIELGLLLGRRSPAGAAIDVSDGLAADAARLCRRSGVGCELDEGALALRADARRLAGHLGRDPLELVLGGGEDYVLLFTLPPDAGLRHPGCRPIGRITARPGLKVRRVDGTIEPLAAGGWDHLSD